MARTSLPYSPDVTKLISVDRIAGIDYQDTKLLDGLDGSTTPARVAVPTDANAAMAGLWIGGQLMVFNGTTWDRARGDITNGLDVDVTRLPSLPTGSNAIGSVTVTNVVPGTGSTNLGKAEDGTHTTGDTGVMILVVRNDAGGALGAPSGDYTPLQTDSAGALRVTGGGGGSQYSEDAVHATGDLGTMSLAVRNDAGTPLAGATGDYIPLSTDANGNLRVTTGSGGTSMTDDVAFTPASSAVTPIGAFADEASPDAVDEGDVGALRMTLQRGLHTNLRSAAGAELPLPAALGQGTMAQSLRVVLPSDQAAIPVTTVTPGTGATHLGKAEDAAHTTGDVGVMSLAVRNDAGTAMAATTGDYIPLTTDASGNLRVTGAGGGQQFAEDAVHASGDLGTMVLAVRNDAGTALAGATGDYIPLTTDSTGALRTNASVKDVGAFAAPANAAVTTTQAQLAAANAARKGLWIENVDSVDTVYWGTTTGVTTANGMPIYPLERTFIPTTGAVHLIAGAAADVRWTEMT